MAIVNNTRKGTTLDLILNSDYEFYLGGSRWMNDVDPELVPINKDTDYDFYVTYTSKIESWLYQNGFNETKSHSGYYDDEAVNILEKDNVQVVLRKDAELYRMCFETIDPEFYANYLWKKSNNCNVGLIQPFFNQLFTLARYNHEKNS